MPNQKKAILYNALGFGVLFLVSLYRQLSIRFLPDDPFRTYILYAGYVALISSWGVSIYTRVTQRTMRICLLLEDGFFLIGLTIRFLQETFWVENTLLMRVSGQYVAATLLPIMLLAVYASLGMGKTDDYRFPKRWYTLLIPVILMCLLVVTDERRHFISYIIPEEPQPNLAFHPYIGAILLVVLGLALIIARILIITKRNGIMKHKRLLRWIVPYFEPILMLFVAFIFFTTSLNFFLELTRVEVIEMYGKIYYFEALTWEFYIYIGLVPVNTCYEDVFKNSTIAMQLVDGNVNLRSKYAAALSPELLGTLKSEGKAVLADKGAELHLYPLENGYFVWQKDTSRLQSTIDALRRSAEELRHEGALLDEEMRVKSEEAQIRAQNRIYDGIVKEVEPQLALMRVLAEKCRNSSKREALFSRLCLIGTYVKRRCNLRLIGQEPDALDEEELRLSFLDMLGAAEQIGICTQMDWCPGNVFSPAFFVYLLSMLEFLLEYERFSIKGLALCVQEGRVSFTVTRDADASERGPKEEVAQMNPAGYIIDWQSVPSGYRLLLSEGGV